MNSDGEDSNFEEDKYSESSFASERNAKSGGKKKPVPFKTTTAKKNPATGNKYSSVSSTVPNTEAKSRKSDNIVSMNEDPSFMDAEDVVIGGGFTSVEDIYDRRPEFIKEENVRDIEGRRPDDPAYDPTTLQIPKEYWPDFTPAMHQYWEIKQNNYDKLLLFKLGKFYELFHHDAIVG